MNVINTTTKKLIWPDYHIWYANTPKLKNLIGTNPIHIVPVDNRFRSSKTIEISNTKVNNYKFGIIDVRSKQVKSIISGTLQDIDTGFVHVNKRAKFDGVTATTAISNVVSMIVIDRMITCDQVANKGKYVKLGRDVTLDQLLNQNLYDGCKQIAGSVLKLISNAFGYQIIDNQRNNVIANTFGYDPDIKFYIVNKQYLTGSTGIRLDKSTIQHFNNSSVITTAINNLRFVNRDLFAVKFAKAITNKRADVVIENVTRNRLPNADSNRTFQLKIATDFQSFDILYKSSQLTVSIGNTGLKAILTHNKQTVNLSSKTISTVGHNTTNTLLENYVDHLDEMKSDLQPVYKTFSNSVIFDNMTTLIDNLVDKYPDIEQQQDKDNAFKLIRMLSSLSANIDRFSVDVLFEYMYNASIASMCNNHIIIS